MAVMAAAAVATTSASAFARDLHLPGLAASSSSSILRLRSCSQLCKPLSIRSKRSSLLVRAEGSPDASISSNSSSNTTSSSNTASSSSNTSSSKSVKKSLKDKSKSAQETFRDRAFGFLEQQAGYFWLAGPVIATAAIVLPSLTFSLPELLQKNYWLGLAGIFGLDLMFVLAADAFFMLCDKTGAHQKLPGGSPAWVGPWQISGYPPGLPQTWDYTCYVGVAVAAFSLVMSLFLRRLGVALLALAPYMALVLVQAAYERLLCGDKLPTFPLVPIVFTVYRFKQLARAVELFVVFDGGLFLVWTVRFLMGLWTFYLASFLSQLPWMYSTWGSSKVA